MRKLTRLLYVLLFSASLFMYGCKNKDGQPPKEDKKIDSLIQKTDEEIQDVNEGVKEGYDNSKEELKDGIDKIRPDSAEFQK